MRQSIKFLLSFLFVFLLFITSSCEKEIYDNANTDNYKSKYISIQSKKFSDLKFDNRFTAPFEKVKNSLKNNAATNKSVFGVEVDTTIVNEVLHEDFTTYSLAVKSTEDNPNYFENLAIKIDDQNQTSAAILKYYFDSQKNIISMETNPVYGDFLDAEEVETDNLGTDATNRCMFIQIIISHPCTNGNVHTNGIDGHDCSMDGSNAYDESIFFQTCSGGFGVPSYPINSGTTDISGPKGGFAPIPLTNAQLYFLTIQNNIVFEKFQILKTQASIALENYLNNNPYNTINNNNITAFFNSLSNQQTNWLNNQSDETQTNIINYLTQNNFNNQSSQFTQELIDLAIENDSTFQFDDTIDSANSLNFDNVSDFQDYLNNIPTDGFDFEVEDDLQTNQKIAKVKLALTGVFGGVNFKIKQNMTPSYSIADVTSSEYGFTLAFSWEQANYYVNINPITNIATINISGDLHYNIFIEGVGTVWTSEIEIQVTLNMTTGTIISAIKLP